MWTKFSQALSKKTKGRGNNNVFIASSVCYIAFSLSQGKFKPLSYKNKMLTVAVLNPAAASSLMLSQNQIKKEINQKLGGDFVEKIKIKQSF